MFYIFIFHCTEKSYTKNCELKYIFLCTNVESKCKQL